MQPINQPVQTNSVSPPASQLTTQYPGAFGLIKPSIKAIKIAFAPVFAVLGISLLISGLILVTSNLTGIDSHTKSNIDNIAYGLIAVLTLPLVTFAVLSATRGVKKSLSELIQFSIKNIWRFFLASLLYGLMMIGGFILFVVPGIIVLIRLSMVFFIMTDDPAISPVNALKRSWALTNGHSAKVLGIMGVNIMISIVFYIPIVLAALTMVGNVISTSLTSHEATLNTGPITLFMFVYFGIVTLLSIALAFYSAALPLLYNYILSSAQTPTQPVQT